MSVYAIQAVDGGPVKIGYSGSPEQRLVQLQTAHHSELSIILSFEARPEHERRLHERLVEYALRGEWYEDREDVWLALHATRAGLALERLIESTIKDLIPDLGNGLTKDAVIARLAALGEDVADILLALEHEAIEALQAFKSREDVRA